METPEDGLAIGDIVVTKVSGYGRLKGIVVSHLAKDRVAVMYLDGSLGQQAEKDCKLIRPRQYLREFSWAEADRARGVAYKTFTDQPEGTLAEVSLTNYALTVVETNTQVQETQMESAGVDPQKAAAHCHTKVKYSFVERKYN